MLASLNSNLQTCRLSSALFNSLVSLEFFCFPSDSKCSISSMLGPSVCVFLHLSSGESMTMFVGVTSGDFFTNGQCFRSFRLAVFTVILCKGSFSDGTSSGLSFRAVALMKWALHMRVLLFIGKLLHVSML